MFMSTKGALKYKYICHKLTYDITVYKSVFRFREKIFNLICIKNPNCGARFLGKCMACL